jgi:hypothetical protein
VGITVSSLPTRGAADGVAVNIGGGGGTPEYDATTDPRSLCDPLSGL